MAALEDNDGQVRERAVRALMKLGGSRVVEPLLAALKGSDENVRQEAASTPGDLRDEQAMELFLAALKDSDEDVRQEAASALRKIVLAATLFEGKLARLDEWRAKKEARRAS